MKLQLKENSPTVLFKVHDNDEDFTRCNFAIVKFTPELLKRISKLREARDLTKCYEIKDFYGSTNFLNQDEFATESGEENISEELLEHFEEFTKNNKGAWQIEAVELEDVPMIRTQADIVHVSEFGVKFSAYMKYAGIKFDTEKISWEDIEKMTL